MSWHKVTFTNKQVAEGEHQLVHNKFAALVIAAGAPKEMALFSGKFTHKGLSFYFSAGSVPYASELISAYSGTPCEAPERGDDSDVMGTALLVGNDDAWDLLK
jgi:hypothetical protein